MNIGDINNPKLRERIRLAEQSTETNYRDQAKANHSQPVAGLVRAEPEHRASQALDAHPPKQAKRKKGSWLVHVLIVRVGKKYLDDDNLAASFKGFRDAIADELQIDDGDSRIKFDYDQVQTRGATGTHVLITRL